MQLDAADLRPRSLFDRGALSPLVIAGGAATLALVYVVLPMLVLAVVAILAVAGIDLAPSHPEEPPPIENVIQARFLQLGEQLDPHQLPNRHVPILRTDTAEPAPSKNAPMERPEQHERQPRSVTDALQRLSEDAQIFAEREERRVQEGDPEGMEGGDREASEGDLYAGRLSTFLKRGWTVPTTIARDELQSSTTMVAIEIGDDLKIHSFRITRSSGNPEFDLSVTGQLQRLVDSQSTIPPPPEEQADQYIGRTRAFAFRGRDAH